MGDLCVMDDRPDPMRAYADAVRADDRPLATLIARRLFHRAPQRTAGDTAQPPSAAAHAVLRRLRDQLGI